MKKKKIYPTSFFFHNFCNFFCHFGYFLAIFGKKKPPNSCCIFAFQLWVGSKKLPPSCNNKDYTYYPVFGYIQGLCTASTVKVCNGCRKVYYQTPVLFNDEQNTVVFCHFGYCFGHFWQNTHIKLPCTI